MSTGIWNGSFALEDPDLTELRAVRAALAPLRNETWYADVQVFARAHEGERFAHAFVVHRAALARMIERFESFWGGWGITPETHPSELLAVGDRMPKADRWRGFGHLFGYPADAVDFFVAAGLAAEAGGPVGPGQDRQFVQIETFGKETGRFTYAAPKEHVPSRADEARASEAARILDAYRERRRGMDDVRAAVAQLERLNRRFEPAARRAAAVRDTRQPDLETLSAPSGMR